MSRRAQAPRSRRRPRGAKRADGSGPYARFARLDGHHPFKNAVADGHVAYAARRRHDGHITYFNFDLAREMGLIPTGHPDRLTAALKRIATG